MKSARQWTQEFCIQHIIPSKGNVVEDFVRAIQIDAVAGLVKPPKENADETETSTTASQKPTD